MSYHRSLRLFCFLFLALIAFRSSAQSNSIKKSNSLKPNIIFILADDLGYGDVKSMNENGKIHTPNIDQISKNGIKFTDAHTSSSVCTPSRYAILTGRYNWRSALKNGVLGVHGAPLIKADRTTMASMLQQKGYQTACIGKWHLGFNWKTKDDEKPIDNVTKNNLDYTARITGGPVDVGFGYFYGVDAPNYPPYTFICNDKLTGTPNQFLTFAKELDSRPGTGEKSWDQEKIIPTLQQKTVSYIQKAAKNKKPFFLYLPLTGPHTPIVPTPEFKGKSGLNIYADFVMQIDAYVGAVLDALKKTNISNNTIIVFTSDNGCSPHANFAELEAKGHDPSYIFRGAKADIFEGGHRVACVMQWPAMIAPNREIKQTISMVDFFSTFAHIADYNIKDNEAEDSYNMYDAITNSNYAGTIRNDVVMHSIDGSFSIRKGNWKLELCPGSGGWSKPRSNEKNLNLPPIQLYDLANDIEEKNNVEAQYPDIVKELTALLSKYIKDGRSTPGSPQKNDGTFIPERMFFLSGK